MDFQSALETVKKETEKEITLFFQEKQTRAKGIDGNVLPVVEHIADFTLRGGKRMRAFLCWLGYFSRHDPGNQAVKLYQNLNHFIVPSSLSYAMISLELFQSFCLIHDDIIDQDTTRRGGLTLHELFKSKVESRKSKVLSPKSKVSSDEHFGTSMAILAGDLALAWSDELMDRAIRLSLRAERSNLSMKEIAASSRCGGIPRNDTGVQDLYQHMKEEVILGQLLDVLSQFGQAAIPEDKINELKTAWYSVVRPLQIGAALAGGDDEYIRNLAAFGVPVGKLFQLKDDRMDGEVEKSVFQRESVRLTNISKEALGNLSLSPESKQLFFDLVTFVLTRTS